MDFGSDAVMYVLIALTTGYAAVSILIELLSILFLLTPTEKDDRFMTRLREQWDKGRKYIDWLSVRTPLTKALRKIRKLLADIRTDLKDWLDRRRAKKNA